MIWILVTIVGLLAETSLIVVLGRQVTAAYEEAPLVAGIHVDEL